MRAYSIVSICTVLLHAHTRLLAQIHYGNMRERLHKAVVEFEKGAAACDQRSPNGFLHGFIVMDGVLAARTLRANSIYSTAVSATANCFLLSWHLLCNEIFAAFKHSAGC
jgi:hypothetical protein